MVKETDWIWMDGTFIPWQDAQIHVLTHSLHYGVGVFEGIRCYEQVDGQSAILRLKEHMQRLEESARMFWLEIPYSIDELCHIAVELFAKNKLSSGYLRPIVYIGPGDMGLYAPNNPVCVSMIAWPWGAYLGDDALKKGIRAKISSYNRLALNVNLSKTKACGNYINSILAKRESIFAGYDEALLLDTEGYLTEGSGENLFIVKDDLVLTPPLSSSILNGITRKSVLEILKDEGIPHKEKKFVREDACLADEVFLTGTAAEITPVREIDDHKIGNGSVGPITKRVQDIYFDAVVGKIKKYQKWLTQV